MLYIIGLGLGNEKDITVNGLECVKKCDIVYLENYTSKLQCNVEDIEKFYGKKIILAERGDVEGDEEKSNDKGKSKNPIIEDAKSKTADENIGSENTKSAKPREKNVALLVIGDPMGATTHVDMMLRCKKLGIKTKVIHNASILNAVGIVGLELYKYGKTTSIPFPEENFQPETAYDVLKDNLKMGLHSLCLLDLRPSENRFMTIGKAINILLNIESKRKEKIFTEDTLCIGCARIGSDDMIIRCGKAKDLMDIKKNDLGKPPHCLIIPGKMHFMEKEALKMWREIE
ncbi:MAG: diphthine synthase [Candidatus Woesearchaeota archaeon]